MERPGLRELLIRAVLDPDFRDRARSDPEAAFADFDLSEPERTALRQGGDQVLGLIGSVLGVQPAAAGVEEAKPDKAPAPPLVLTVRLLLRLMQSIDAVAGGQGQLHFTAALQPLPEGADPAAMPAPEVDAAALPGARLDDILLEIRIMPHVARGEGGEFEVSFRHAVLPVAMTMPRASGGPGSTAGPAPAALRERAAAVRRAAPDGRYAALLDLIGALDEDTADA